MTQTSDKITWNFDLRMAKTILFYFPSGWNKISHRTTLKCFHSYYDNRLTVPLITCQILFKYLQGVSAQPLKVTLALKGTCCADFQLHITILQYLNTKCNFWQHRKEVRGSNKPFCCSCSCCLLKHIHPSWRMASTKAQPTNPLGMLALEDWLESGHWRK